MSKEYIIPITWQSFREYTVIANNLQDAITQSLKKFMDQYDSEYIQDSFEIDTDLEYNYPNEPYDERKVLKEVFK